MAAVVTARAENRKRAPSASWTPKPMTAAASAAAKDALVPVVVTARLTAQTVAATIAVSSALRTLVYVEIAHPAPMLAAATTCTSGPATISDSGGMARTTPPRLPT